MNANDLVPLVPWVIAHGYLIFLIVAVVEGPFATMAGGVAAGLGYYDLYIIMGLALLGDIIGDFVFYGVGYAIKGITHSRLLRYLGLTQKRIDYVEKVLHNHMFKTVVLIKISPMIGPFGLMIIGAAKTSFKRFILSALIVAVPKSIIYVLIGYFSAETYLGLSKFFAKGQYVLFGAIVFLALCYFAYMKIMKAIAKKLEK